VWDGGDKRQKTKGKRQKAKGKRQKAKGKGQNAKGKTQKWRMDSFEFTLPFALCLLPFCFPCPTLDEW
jgi:hypothetical protein